MSSPRSSDTPSIARESDDQLEVGPSRAGLDYATGSEVGELIAQTVVTLMAASGADAEQAYQENLDLLRERADDAVAAVGAQYDALEEDQYLERWSMIQLLTDLRHTTSVRLLGDRPVHEHHWHSLPWLM